MNYLSVLNKDLNLVNSINFNDKFVYLNRECNLKHWNSHFDHQNKIQLMILGRPIIEVLDWAKFDKSEENYIICMHIKIYTDVYLHIPNKMIIYVLRVFTCRSEQQGLVTDKNIF